jgi:hypothetical protein
MLSLQSIDPNTLLHGEGRVVVDVGSNIEISGFTDIFINGIEIRPSISSLVD